MPGIVTAELTYGDTKWHEEELQYTKSLTSLPVLFLFIFPNGSLNDWFSTNRLFGKQQISFAW